MSSALLDRYASAIFSGNLKSDPLTTRSDSDVLGAAGLAAKEHGLAIALARLFAGDNGAAHELARVMADMAQTKARELRAKIRDHEAREIGAAVLAWHREGKCRQCGGHGFQLIPGTRTVGEQECRRCNGTGRLPFDSEFCATKLPIARWLLAEVEREQGKAGAAAMKKLAPKLHIS